MKGAKPMKSVNTEIKRLGFLVVVPHQMFIRDLGKYTTLIIEGKRLPKYSEYRYDFYKTTYHPRQKGTKVKVYVKEASAYKVIKKVKGFMDYIGLKPEETEKNEVYDTQE
ncbi:hypothetical protein B7C51_08480 [Paenibacillus larvae subsp. pulvifaciens]|uniref:Uncharacterized protein n=2 Tax=Paenibacillus larvae TaxID=1464 RepID=A0A1V0US02_9BACL|nr:hypothetical protein B7C51_08480 [Paenibacillus larvae subsp. pulvifaciens]